ncbi:hypothetical protein ACEPAF_8170 [Sanghuangporus sanghuang]|uniref:Uncharacterized protein n=1 Tax=Sanghuangporus baumii TaxID=108892 RepID=A0A9Q5N7R7_SANBA|nr:hypothetical protein A7U60_g2711 [Sanghuangporus baumii]
MHHEYKSVSTTSDKYNEHPNPFAPALYSPAQLDFFGDFLRSPFAASPCPASNCLGISPFDVRAHEDSMQLRKVLRHGSSAA